MELNRYDMASVKRTAQTVKSKRAKIAKLNAKIDALIQERDSVQSEIDTWESPIIKKFGYSSEQILSGEADAISSQLENMQESVNVEEIEDTTSSEVTTSIE